MKHKIFKDTPCIKHLYPRNFYGNYTNYYEQVMGIIDDIKDEFPLLKIVVPPTVKPAIISLVGWLVSRELYDRLDSYNGLEQYTIYVKCDFYNNIDKREILVQDWYELIDRGAIPYEYKHFYSLNGDESYLCTHYSDHLKHYSNKELAILKSAEALVQEYKRFEVTGEFNLDCYPHPEDNPKAKYNKEKRNYERLQRLGKI